MAVSPTTWLVIDRARGDLEGQIHRSIRERILSGRLASGDRLPSSRSLSALLGVSRSTVVQVFQRLRSEGFLDSRPGASTRVAPQAIAPQAAPSASASRAGARSRPAPSQPALPFQPGIPDLDAFPCTQWARCLGVRARSLRIHDLGYGAPAGLPELQAAVLAHVSATRGVLAQPDQVVILPSAGAAIDMITRMLIRPGKDIAWIEEPGYPRARALLASSGAQIVPIPCDSEGIDVSRPGSDPPRVIYVTPSHQYPTGVTMSLPRRLTLLECAHMHDAVIIEDDYDSEFHYASRPIAALQGIDRSDRVAYVGTFSKVLAPGLRVAYAIVPRAMIGMAMDYLRHRGGTVPIHVQAALADFIDEGHLRAQVRRMRAVYAERMAAMVSALQEHCHKLFDMGPEAGGLQLAAWSRDTALDDAVLEQHLRMRGIGAQALSSYFIGRNLPGLLIGIAQAAPAKAQWAARTIATTARAISSQHAQPSTKN